MDSSDCTASQKDFEKEQEEKQSATYQAWDQDASCSCLNDEADVSKAKRQVHD